MRKNRLSYISKRLILFLIFSVSLFINLACSAPVVEVTRDHFQEVDEALNHLKVHYLDVGQGDSILIELPNGQTMLIDGGTRSQGEFVLDYLTDLEIGEIDYLIGTHPHEDHIGGLIEVIKRHEVGEIYMPKVSHNTKAFEDLILAIKSKDKKIISAKAGDVILDQEKLSIEILGPDKNYQANNLNNYSVVVRLAYKNSCFLFTGDAEKEAESLLVGGNQELNAEVLKVAHHGSHTSTTDEFLNAVAPKFAVISCGLGNKYGHPSDETMRKLKAKNIKVFRTDLDGTILATSDGETIIFTSKQ